MNEIVRAYFDAQPKQKEEEVLCHKIVDILSQKGCNVIQTTLGIEWDYMEEWGREAATNIYSSKIEDIKSSDIIVLEMSRKSHLLDFEAVEAINQSKPSLILFNKNKNERPDVALLGHPSSNLKIIVYKEENLEKIIEDFLKKAQKKVPRVRFTVRLSEEINNYLKFLKAKLKLSSKNDVVNKILEEKMKNDPDYQNIKL
ncbi:MAG: hypothetical protein U9M98_01495 [Patescibacteria group bacterium]|nr:hypothetical protein [Patescibacteria group bacterium]